MAKVLDVDTSNKYEVAPALAVQLAVKPVEVLFVVDGEPGVGGDEKVNAEAPLAEPLTPYKRREPEVPDPVTAIICVPLLLVTEATGVPPTVIKFAFVPICVKFVPEIVIVEPGHPLDGVKDEIVGNAVAGGAQR